MPMTKTSKSRTQAANPKQNRDTMQNYKINALGKKKDGKVQTNMCRNPIIMP